MNLRNRLFPLLKSALRYFLGVPLTLLSFYFIALTIIHSKNNIIPFLTSANILILLLGLLFFTCYFLLRSVLWYMLLKKEDKKLPVFQTLFFHSYSETRRYVPGNIFSFVSRVNNFKSDTAPTKKVLQLMLLEYIISGAAILVIVISAFWTLSTFLSSTNDLVMQYASIQRIITVLSIVFLCALLVFGIFYKLFSVKISGFLTFITVNIDAILLAILAWICYGAGSYFVATSFSYLNLYYIYQFTAFFVLAWLIGFLSFVTPMGLGIREGVITFGLSAFLAPYQAASIAVGQRIILIAAELIFLAVSLLLYKISKTKNTMWVKKIDFQFAVVLFFVLSYVFYFTYLTFEKHANFFTGRFDLGNMDQTVWNTLHGRFFMLTNPDSTNIISRLGIHADFILILLSPFYIIWEDPRMLLFIQTAVIACGGIFVYLIGRRVIKSKNISCVLALSYLFNPFIQKQNLYDFHGVSLATTFLLGTYYFLLRWLHRKKGALQNNYDLRTFLLFLVLSALTKENIYLITALFGLYLCVKNCKRIGVPLFIGSLVIFYYLVSYAIPNARGGAHFALSYFNEFGDSPNGIIESLALNPAKTFSLLLTYANYEYVRQLLLPVGYIALFSPLYLIFSLPDFAINLLSKNENLKSVNFHYAAAIIPFVYISAIYGAYIIKNKLKISEKVIFYVLLFFTVKAAWEYGVLPGSKHPSLEIYVDKTSERSSIETFLSKLPQNLSIAATNNLGAHLSHRERLFTIPNGIYEADVVIFLLNDEFAQPSLSEQKNMVMRLDKSPKYRIIYHTGDFYAFERKGESNFLE